MTEPVAETVGLSAVFVDPVWRVEVALTPLERRLLRSRSVRRLAFVSHAGPSAMVTTQAYSRLEHSLGLLALVAHFAPADYAARAAALLHDVGHLPFSHCLEGLAGLDHHALGAARVRELAPDLEAGGIDAEEVLAIDRGERPSVLRNDAGSLRLDHLESFVRSGRSHGRTLEPPPHTLRRLNVTNGAVSCDASTAAYLTRLIVSEARSQLSEINVIANAVLRSLVQTLLLDGAELAYLAELADDELWALLLANPRTAPSARRLREDPLSWRATAAAPTTLDTDGKFDHEILRLYLDLPLVDDGLAGSDLAELTALPTTPVRYIVSDRA